MKKILAIALAAAMVLSMTAAFAFNFNFTCAAPVAKEGKATLEVIPYVKVNNGCGTFDWVQSDCAGAVKTENIYFLIKLTVPKDINPIWWKYLGTDDQITVSADKTGILDGGTSKKLDLPDNLYTALKTSYKDDSSDGWVFYANPAAEVKASSAIGTYKGSFADFALDTTTDWYEATEGTDAITDYMFALNVTDARKAKVTAKMTSNFDGYDEWLTFGSYKVLAKKASTTTLTFIESCITTPDVNDKDVAAVNDKTFAAGTQIFTLEADAATGKLAKANSVVNSCTAGFENAVLSYFGIGFGSCINADTVKASFGWKDVVNAPWTWSGNATAIVDVQCEVEIPKTGDVSVIAYAVMAVVAAAGAMGLKK